MLHQLEQAVADSLSMARNVATSAEAGTEWDPAFRERWRTIALSTADAVQDVDLDTLKALCQDLEDITHEFADAHLSAQEWREYAGLLMNLRNVHDALTRAVEWELDATPDRRRSKRQLSPQELLRREHRSVERRASRHRSSRDRASRPGS